MIDEHRDQDRKDDGEDQDRPSPPSGIQRYQSQIERIKEFLCDHDPRLGIQGKEVKSNITDNQSAKLKSGSGYIQGYNALAMVDARHQIIVHAEPVGQMNEAPLLPRMVRRAVHALCRAGLAHATEARVVADTNYFTEDNARFLMNSTLDGYIPDNQFRNRDQRFAERSRARRAAHRRFTQADYLYDAASDSYRCPADKRLGRHTRATVTRPPGTVAKARYIPRGRNQLHTIFGRHLEEFCGVYDERYAAKYGMFRLDHIRDICQRFLTCGDYRLGVARIRCTNPACGHDCFPPFSCMGFYLCPSCSQRRTLLFAEHLANEIPLDLPASPPIRLHDAQGTGAVLPGMIAGSLPKSRF